MAEVLSALARLGFASFLSEAGLDGWLTRGREWLRGQQADSHAEARKLPMPERLRLVLEELGPTFIKLGQVLSTRPDLVPPEIAEEFRKLQSNCPTIPFEGVRERIDEALDHQTDRWFMSIDPEPLAAGSIAQTHRGLMRDGRRVVLKVLRPGIHQQIETDLEVLREIAKFVEGHFHSLGFQPTRVVETFSRQLRRELDLMNEGRSADRLNEAFEDHPGVSFPVIHWSVTREDLLVMDEVVGAQLSDTRATELSQADRRQAVHWGAEAVFRMCLEQGFFHADPHPGNIIVQSGGKVCFIDCGMTGNVDAATRRQLAQLLRAIAEADLDRSVRTAVELAEADPALETDRRFRSDAWELIWQFQVDRMDRINVAAALEGFFEILRKHHVQCPADLVMLIKAITTIHHVGRELDPDFDLVGLIRPMVQRLVREHYGARALRRRAVAAMGAYLEVMEALPTQIRRINALVHQRDFSVRLEHKGLDDLQHAITRTGRSVSVAMIIAAIILGSSILINAEGSSPSWGLFTWVGLGSLAMAFSFLAWLGLEALRNR